MAIWMEHFVIIFDECYKSWFREMHTKIVRAFKKYHLFGFTGMPIFAANGGRSGSPPMRTTPQAFGEKLHTYTIVDTINEGNLLPFRIDYVITVKIKSDVMAKDESCTDTEKVMVDPA